MASRASREVVHWDAGTMRELPVVHASWDADTMRELPPASLLERDLSWSSEAISEVESTGSSHLLDRMMMEMARAPPGADLNSIASAHWAAIERDRNRPIAASRSSTGDDADLEALLHPGVSSGSQSQSPAITEANTGLTGVQQQQQSVAYSSSSHQAEYSRSQEPAIMEIGRAVNARGRPFAPL
eukprot:TRINITY_DN13919_c0_g1_i1.p1 TRINITY_DN13919_c0_g1~~TRINITY_DN13919_c0_g1_i1.p1  ORF type:complete len:185 (-),score=39.83 TRINITY_DN13919_c0_g1_i1:49-603(-)